VNMCIELKFERLRRTILSAAEHAEARCLELERNVPERARDRPGMRGLDDEHFETQLGHLESVGAASRSRGRLEPESDSPHARRAP